MSEAEGVVPLPAGRGLQVRPRGGVVELDPVSRGHRGSGGLQGPGDTASGPGQISRTSIRVLVLVLILLIARISAKQHTKHDINKKTDNINDIYI